jgi:hypothetical protein
MSITCNGVVAPHDSFIIMQATGESGPVPFAVTIE